jgi:hypothetical protein
MPPPPPPPPTSKETDQLNDIESSLNDMALESNDKAAFDELDGLGIEDEPQQEGHIIEEPIATNTSAMGVPIAADEDDDELDLS